MSNSSLVNYTRWSPNYSSRNGSKIDKITIHHMAGNLSVETCGSLFANPSREVSATYGIGSDGRVGQYVDEANRPWTTASYENDRRAVTIEVANDEIGGQWHVSDAALSKTIDLCVDICERNGIPRLNYTGDKTGNLTMHCWYAATACPGPYLKSKFAYIAAVVNQRLSGKPKPTPPGKLDVDGIGGPATITALQKFLGTPQDGEISGQYWRYRGYYPNITAVTYNEGGSLCVEKLQEYLTRQGYPTNIDGGLGPSTIIALQSFLNAKIGAGLSLDGVAGPATVKALQRWLNTV